MVFRERSFSVLLVSASEKFNSMTTALLQPELFEPAKYVRSAGEARRSVSEREYDLVLINAPLPDELGSRLARDLCTNGGAGVLLLVKSELYEAVNDELMEYGVMVLSKPTSTLMVSQTLRMLCAARERFRRFEEKQASVEEKMREIRLVNQAKWVLITERGFNENEAHRLIEKQAMDERSTKSRIAERIIEAAHEK